MMMTITMILSMKKKRRPSNADSTVDVAKEPLVPNKLAVAPPQTAKVVSYCPQALVQVIPIQDLLGLLG